MFRRGETPVRFQMCGFVEAKRTNRKEENKEKEGRPQTKEKIGNVITLPGWANHDGRDRFYCLPARPPAPYKYEKP